MRKISKVIAAGATALMLAGVASAAHADPVNVNVTPGSLTVGVGALTSFEAPINVTGVTRLTQPMTITVEDATGSNAGWTVHQSVTDMTYFGNGAGWLAAEAFQVQAMTSMTQELDAGQTAIPGSEPSFNGGNGDLGFGQTVLTAAAGQGAGKYVVVADLAVVIPRSTEPGTYAGTLNTTITSGSI